MTKGERCKVGQPLARIAGLALLAVLLFARLLCTASRRSAATDDLLSGSHPDLRSTGRRLRRLAARVIRKDAILRRDRHGLHAEPLRSANDNRQSEHAASRSTIRSTGQLITCILAAGMEFKRGASPSELSFRSRFFRTAERIRPGAGRRSSISSGTSVAYDLRLNAKLKVYQSDDRKLQLGVGGAALTAPTGNTFSFGGDGQATRLPLRRG